MNLEYVAAPEPKSTSGETIWSMNTRREKSGELSVAGVPVTALAAEYGTPTFVLDTADARARARAWRDEMNEAFSPEQGLAGARVYYAGKAFLCKQFARWMVDDGLYLDTASLGELTTALAAGVPGERCGLHGNNKSREEIELALREGVAHIVIDSLDELDYVERIAAELRQVAPVYLRLTTGVHAGGHEFISTAHEDQKFGLSISTGVAREAMRRAAEAGHVNLLGLHSHIGSQIASEAGFEAAADIILAERAWAAEQGIAVDEIDLGGGYGVRYTSADPVVPSAREFAQTLANVVNRHVQETGLSAPKISIEPGRSIIAPAMLMLYSVGTVKDVAIDSGVRTYVSVNGGMSDNIRPALYEADYTAALANRVSGGGLGVSADVSTLSSDDPEAMPAGYQRCRVVGKHCESGDIVVRNVALPVDIHRGDLLAVPAVGAYGYAMASNYNMLTKPAVVAVENGHSSLLIRRQTVDDLLTCDMG